MGLEAWGLRLGAWGLRLGTWDWGLGQLKEINRRGCPESANRRIEGDAKGFQPRIDTNRHETEPAEGLEARGRPFDTPAGDNLVKLNR